VGSSRGTNPILGGQQWGQVIRYLLIKLLLGMEELLELEKMAALKLT